jgi:hypothetical protein
MLKVLVAPLDWGLGHATRCIPIIKELISQGCTVIIAAGGAQKTVLQEEFPDLSFVEMPGFWIKYGKNRAFTLFKIIFSIPKILIGIKRENQWLRRFAGREGLDLVISDNRYGLHGAGVFSVFMTHQLAIRTSFGVLADELVRRINYAFIRRFSACWVPDLAGAGNLAGKLSNPIRMPDITVRYIGWLSRLETMEEVEEVFELLILLSGPEPQRTILEEMLLAQMGRDAGVAAAQGVAASKIVLVRGLPGGGGAVKGPEGLRYFDYLPAKELGRVIGQSRLVLARPGYSTVMDLVRLGRKAIYIPTPGQPEQEYLGWYLEEQGWGICRRQRGFVLGKAIKGARELMDREAGREGVPGGGEGILREEIRKVLAQSAVGDLG